MFLKWSISDTTHRFDNVRKQRDILCRVDTFLVLYLHHMHTERQIEGNPTLLEMPDDTDFCLKLVGHERPGRSTSKTIITNVLFRSSAVHEQANCLSSCLLASPNDMTVLIPLDEFVPSAFTTTIHS